MFKTDNIGMNCKKFLRCKTSCSLMSVEMITEYKVSTKCVPVDMISMTNVLLLNH